MTEREASREKFEALYGPAAADSEWKLRDKWDPDTYASSYVQTAWWFWQASRRQALQEAYDAMFYIKGCRVTRFDAQTAIRSLTTTGDKA